MREKETVSSERKTNRHTVGRTDIHSDQQTDLESDKELKNQETNYIITEYSIVVVILQDQPRLL